MHIKKKLQLKRFQIKKRLKILKFGRQWSSFTWRRRRPDPPNPPDRQAAPDVHSLRRQEHRRPQFATLRTRPEHNSHGKWSCLHAIPFKGLKIISIQPRSDAKSCKISKFQTSGTDLFAWHPEHFHTYLSPYCSLRCRLNSRLQAAQEIDETKSFWNHDKTKIGSRIISDSVKTSIANTKMPLINTSNQNKTISWSTHALLWSQVLLCLTSCYQSVIMTTC